MGRPRLPLEVRRTFWRLIHQGLSTRQAAVRVGVSTGQAAVWFREAGGMAPIELSEPSGRYLSLAEREEVAIGLAAGRGVRAIARSLGRAPSTVSREVARNSRREWPVCYRPSLAQAKAAARARRPKPARLASCPLLARHVQDMLLAGWSPQQISGRLRSQFPDDGQMRVSHEAIYQALFVQGRGGLRRELTACLRTGRALRRPRRRVDGRRERIKDMVLISARPAEVADRAVPGHWEGDLIIGAASRSAIGTLVERTTRFTLLLHLPADHRAETVRDAVTETITTLPAALRRSLTWDRGIELARHAEITVAAGLPVYFCDPASPWQRGTNENTVSIGDGSVRLLSQAGTGSSG